MPKYRLNRLSGPLWVIVAILGLATFAVSLGSPVPIGFPVRVSVLAAIVAAVGLLPSQPGRGSIVAPLAVTGFLDALATWTRVSEPELALTFIAALNALQSIAAMTALLCEGRTSNSAETRSPQDYSAYTRLVQAYQAYAAQYQQPSVVQYNAAQADAQAQAEAAARATQVRAEGAQESFGALQARYARHGVGTPVRQRRMAAGEVSLRPFADTGVPSVALQPDSYNSRRESTARNVIEPTGP